MKKIIFILLIISSCSKVDSPIPTDEVIYLFEDGFETQGNALEELLPSNGSRWTNIQQVNPDNGINAIEIESNLVLEGNSSLRIFASASDSTLSKADIEKGGFIAPEGATIRIETNFYIASTENLENLLLIDLECCACWDPTVPDNQCPGIRLMMKSNDFLSIERGKILGATITQTAIAFPRNEWVNVVWEMKLSPNNDGVNKLFINDHEAISESGMNMPNASIFEIEFATHGIDFELQEAAYERVQVGATANPTLFDIEMYIDQVKLEIEE
ncbi:MAG: hypothetical protein OCD76_05770 [Reichenbachiella sp.]